MGQSLSAAQRVKGTLINSSDFITACDAAYDHCLSLTQHAFPGVFPYQLPSAADHIHSNLTTAYHHHLILRWVPSPPNRTQVDSALKAVLRQQKSDGDEIILGHAQFKDWATMVFVDAVVGNAVKTVLARVPIGVAGIVGVGAVTRSRKDWVGAAIGVYALSVATSVYLGLSG
ncbi:hypothetical protein K2173_019170 [Erythroxylum novogranatense]|uniref:Uncharacterized protein n=1 Tax=Erythroxylum novogranatense TaxID=1862640 RepID=A0AAV8SSX4_9ROSI|nr:hypothetical protein K2173_019170 [Erythroxylum novogranatense]